ncbi:response regulator transcription factor [Streptococcus oricebi]|uniref:DNA-binding response regulator n=1 Tax=Streptococcus oricebi TaxID=1547447 RepID=A0ABS5B3T2_9STRE|nr:response regulator transcription factor [Streptococcus oricebi]MBP2623484.1 DNA-binding response regulator [Streptococcus oricebi]
MAYKILVIDDDLSILRLIKNVLETANYQVDIRSQVDAIDLCDFIDYDLILLDVMMPVSGFDICEAIRPSIKTPILLITAKDMDEDLIKGIHLGADDYITKPFSMETLLARVKMHIRREERNRNTHRIIEMGNISIDWDSKEVKIDGEVIPLTKREFDIVYILSSHPHRTYKKEELYDLLYPQSADAQWRSISEYIYQIRQKFKPYKVSPIKTIWGGGYKWLEPKVSND